MYAYKMQENESFDKIMSIKMANPSIILKFRACAVGIQVQGLHTVYNNYITAVIVQSFHHLLIQHTKLSLHNEILKFT